ncbi:MAG: recombinase family protein [Gammaproteobacteria bacterium]
MPLLGYARVSTQAQDLEPQLRELRNAGCTEIFEEKASGTSRARPELARLFNRLRAGDTLVVVRIDRLARSLSHLLAVIERVRDAGGYFRSLGDPIDTTGPSGMLVLQIMGAIAQFERALIVERTKAGLAAARAQGRVGGNPALRSRDPEVLRRIAAGREQARLTALLPNADTWLAVVRRLRPARPWDEVTQAVNAALPSGQKAFTRERLVRAVRLFVREGLAEPVLLQAAPRRMTRNPKARRAMELAASFLRGRPQASLADIGAELSRMGVTPRSGGKWADSSVKLLLDRARKTGLLSEEHGRRRKRTPRAGNHSA